MSVHFVDGTHTLTINGPAKVELTGNDDPPIQGTLAAPTLTTLTPATHANGSDAAVTLTGTNFNPSSDVLVDGGKVPATYVSATSMTTTLRANAAGTQKVSVRNGSQVSAQQTFTWS